MILRDATSADAGAIAAIWNREIRDGVSTFNTVEKDLGALKAAIASDAVYVVAELDREVVGFATFGPFRGGSGYVHTMEHTIYLDEAARGKGVGRKLMAALEAEAQDRNVHVLVAGVGGENSAGIAFHKAMGFVEVGRMPEVGRKFERWMDLVLLQKRL
ncbi:MAG: GNAT family N-acetyltransferase [Rhodobacteraceae bacterium]|nr:GNAT family N-acetyltransferase [Paracoccaceae bacterium]